MVAPLDVGNLVRETSVTTGTGAQTLVTIDGKRTFNTEFGTGGTDVFDYFISNPDAAEWERGTGHLSSSTVLVRDTVIESSNSDSAVSFTAGTKFVSNDLPASFHGGQWNLLETVVASGVGSVDVINLSSKYFAYKLIWNGLQAVSDNALFALRFSTDNGDNWDAGSSDYAQSSHRMNMATSPTTSLGGDEADDEIWVTLNDMGNASDELADFEFTLINPSETQETKIRWHGVQFDSGTEGEHSIGGGVRFEAAAVNGIQFRFAIGGNISVGTLKIYGVRA